MSDYKPQRLAPRMAVECESCHQRVHFKVVQTKPAADGKFTIHYLKCPCCGHPATQLVEIAETARKRRAIVGGHVF